MVENFIWKIVGFTILILIEYAQIEPTQELKKNVDNKVNVFDITYKTIILEYVIQWGDSAVAERLLVELVYYGINKFSFERVELRRDFYVKALHHWYQSVLAKGSGYLPGLHKVKVFVPMLSTKLRRIRRTCWYWSRNRILQTFLKASESQGE